MMAKKYWKQVARHGMKMSGDAALWWVVLATFGVWGWQVMFGRPLAAAEWPSGALSLTSLQRGEWWTTVTFLLTHDGFMHVATNLLLLVLAGRRVLRELEAQHFIYLYLVSGWVGAALTLGFAPTSAIIGASGSVFGVVGAHCALAGDESLIKPWRGYRMPVLRGWTLFAGLLLAFVALELLARSPGSGAQWEGVKEVAHLGHAGGLLAGYAYGQHRAKVAMETSPLVDISLLLRQRQWQIAQVVKDEPIVEPEAPSDADFLRRQIDPILEKWYLDGEASLTSHERELLLEASQRMRNRGAAGFSRS
jgi:membrane associated rhomboid family serine protease